MKLKDKLQTGQVVYTAWSGIPDPMTVGVLAASDFDAVTLDMQHGGHGDEGVMRSIGPILQNNAHAIVRVPLGRWDMASRALDFGAEAVVAPMVNSIADAKSFANAVKYPPVGERSWGPGAAMALYGYKDPNAYLQKANGETLSFAMIETMEAVAIVDDILALPGIDGVFVGPSDLSITWSNGAFIDPQHAGMGEMMRQVAASAKKAGKFTASFAQDGNHAKHLVGLGFQLIAIGTDVGYLTAGANALVRAAKG